MRRRDDQQQQQHGGDAGGGLEARWSRENFAGMVKLWNLSEPDQEKMRELQQRIADIDHWKNDPYEVIRFYKEYKGKLSKVEKMFRNMIKWREEENMDTFLEDYGEPDPLFQQWPIAMLNTTCKEGDAIYIDRYNVTDFSGFIKKFGSDGVRDYNAKFIREYCDSRMRHNKYRQFTVIGDCQGINSDLLRPSVLGLLRTMTRIGQDYYPGGTKRIIMLRAPKMFSYLFSFGKPFLDKNLQENIVVTTESNYLDVIQKYIDIEDLPPCFYEKGKAQGMPGYFEQVSLEGGPLEVEPSTKRARSVSSEDLQQQYEEEDGGSETSDRTNVSTEFLMRGEFIEEKPGSSTFSITASAS